jgi:hypothetical protein
MVFEKFIITFKYKKIKKKTLNRINFWKKNGLWKK